MSNILDTLSPPALLAPAKPVEDCASCRVIGGLTGTGLGGYALVQAATQARALRASGPVAGGPTTRGLALMAAFGVGAVALGLGRFAGLRYQDGEILTVPEYEARARQQ